MVKTNQILFIVLLSLAITIVISRPLNSRKILFSINAGSNLSKRSHTGFLYDEVIFFNSKKIIFFKDQGFETDTFIVDNTKPLKKENKTIRYSKDPMVKYMIFNFISFN